jgi:hypothetical protein
MHGCLNGIPLDACHLFDQADTANTAIEFRFIKYWFVVTGLSTVIRSQGILVCSNWAINSNKEPGSNS